MRKIIKKLSLLIVVLAWPIISFSSAAALSLPPLTINGSFIPTCAPGGRAAATPICSDVNPQGTGQNNEPINIIRDVINILSFATGVAAIIILILSGYRFIRGSGDSKVVAQAKGGITGAVAGILIVVFAQAFVLFVLNRIK